MSAPLPAGWVVCEPGAFDREALEFMVGCAHAAFARRGRFDVALSGGRSPAGLYRALASAALGSDGGDGTIDWARTHVWFADERAVPPDDPDCNWRQIREALLEPARVPVANVHRLEGERADLEGAARDYEAALPATLDLIVLGMGEDGHVASLFPHSPLLAERTRRVAVVEHSPKPPARRLTLTPAVLLEARALLLLVQGVAKAPAVARLAAGAAFEALPAALVIGRDETRVVLDRAAAGQSQMAPPEK